MQPGFHQGLLAPPSDAPSKQRGRPGDGGGLTFAVAFLSRTMGRRIPADSVRCLARGRVY
jgi:hypothetical protein